MKQISKLIVICLPLFLNVWLFAQSEGLHTQSKNHDALRKQLTELISKYKATTGIALMVLETGDTLTLNNAHHYPMQSTFKFPLAIAVLHEVDRGKLSLNQKIHLTKKDLRPDTWSPLREKYPEGNIDLTIAELLPYMVSQSDNNVCDIFFKLMKGTKPVNEFIHQLGVKEISIAATEYEMTKAWKVQYSNWVQPFDMTQLLEGLYRKKYLSDSSNHFLMRMMIETSTGPKRMKGLLPEGTTVAHKTGTSGTNDGLRAACNDVGIITLPNGKHIALSVYVSDARMEFDEEENLIALISKTVFDYFSK